MDLKLTGKVVWVVGGTGALGVAISRALAEEGAHVVVSSRREDAVAELADSLAGEGYAATGLPLDASDPDKAKAAAASIAEVHGHIDVLVNTLNVPAYGQFLELDKGTFQSALDAKYHGYIATMQAALPFMLDQGGGSIVNITGTGGKLPIAIHMPGGSINAALNLIVKGLATQYGERNVRINAVSPGPIRSPRQDAMQSAGGDSDHAAAAIPMKRFGEATEVADAVLFLASERASYISGGVLNLDGGGIPTA